MLRVLETRLSDTARSPVTGRDDTASFVRLSLAVVCRSIAFIGLGTFISLYATERTDGSRAAASQTLMPVSIIS